MSVDNRAAEFVAALLNDGRFGFKEEGQYLRGGTCPNCGKKELYVRKSQPYRIACGRENNCGASWTIKELFPHLFENWEKRHPATPTNPKATADAFLREDRGFEMVKCRAMYDQENYRLKNGEAVATVRFYLDAGRTRYWERLIGKTKEDGQKANIGGERKADGTLFKGDVWAPADMVVEDGDRIFITEGIFHALALIHAGHKAVAAISSVNFAENYIKAHAGKGVVWCLAYDGDHAGRKYMTKHAPMVKKLGEKCLVHLLPDTGEDWDDYWKTGRLDEKLIEDCFFRGGMMVADSVEEKALYLIAKRPDKNPHYVPFKGAFYRLTIDLEQGYGLVDALSKGQLWDNDRPHLTKLVSEVSSKKRICNVCPQFLYMEKDEVLDDQYYVFNIAYANGTPEKIVRFSGSDLASGKSFGKALLDTTNGAIWSGKEEDFFELRFDWLGARMREVSAINFIGYCPDNKAYIYPEHAWQGGKRIKLNKHGYFPLEKGGVRSNLGGIDIETDGEFKPDFFRNYFKAFSFQGLAVLAFYAGSLFAQQIRQNQKSLFFLEFTGEPGSGKTTVIEFNWKLLGRDNIEGIDVQKTTSAGRRRFFAQTANMPVVIVESDRGAGEDGTRGKIFNFDEFKDYYNGRNTGVTGVATAGNETRESVFRGALVISQNAMVDGSQPLLERICHIHMDKSHHGRGTRELAQWFEQRMAGDVAGFLDVLLSKEREFLSLYFREYKTLLAHFEGVSGLINGRIKHVHAQMGAMARCLRLVFPEFNEALFADFLAYLDGRAVKREERIAADHPVVEKFWEIFHYLEAREVELNHANPSDGTIAINLNHFIQESAEMKQERMDSTQLKSVLEGCKKHKLIGKNKAVHSFITKGTVRCWVFEK